MINACGQLVGKVKRFNCRSVTSVIPRWRVPDGLTVKNEKVLTYLKGSKERVELEEALERTANKTEHVPIVIGRNEIFCGDDNPRYQVMPHSHQKQIAKYGWATTELVEKAIATAVEAQCQWDHVPLVEKVRIWEKAADLMAGPYRQELNAATMLGQAKNIIQAEIDAAAELIDFFRFNIFAALELTKYQPISESPRETLNSMRYRGLEGFVASISPFNFTAIGGNLTYTPALMGCSVLWKPSDTAILSNWVIFKIMREAGLPPGVVNFLPADGPVFGNAVTKSKHLAGINFTGSVQTFNRLWTQVGENINNYRSYPRLIGECGGKNYHFVHPSADVESVVLGTIRSAFEYSGQKCSACSRMYVPESLWPKIKEGLVKILGQVKLGDPTKASTFMSAVIDEKAFKRIAGYIDYAKQSKNCKVIAGGGVDAFKGYFIEPTVIETTDPHDKLMTEEIFGPVLAVYQYPDDAVVSTLDLVATSTPYALTGAIFAQNQDFLDCAHEQLLGTAGNFYINDKSTGSVVGQQPFGGARMSGTNDKAGGPHYVLRWTSPQAIKETFVPITEWDYPYMRE